MWVTNEANQMLTYETITLGQLQQWARAKGIIWNKIEGNGKRTWLVSRCNGLDDFELLYRGCTEKEALWAVFMK